MQKFERALYYPVLIVATLLALMSWQRQPWGLPIIGTLVVAILWIAPFFKARIRFLHRVAFWISFTVLAILGGWIAMGKKSHESIAPPLRRSD